MKTFQASDGTVYEIAVNVATVKRVKDLTGFNLLGLVGDQKSISDLFDDNLRFCEVLCAVIRPQLNAAGRVDDDFYATIDGTVIEAAVEALLVEIVNFFQEPRRSILQKAMDRYQAAYRQVREEGAAEAQKIVEATDFESMIRQTLTSSALS